MLLGYDTYCKPTGSLAKRRTIRFYELKAHAPTVLVSRTNNKSRFMFFSFPIFDYGGAAQYCPCRSTLRDTMCDLCVFLHRSIQNMPEHDYIFFCGCIRIIPSPPQPSVSFICGLLDKATLCLFFKFIFHQTLSLRHSDGQLPWCSIVVWIWKYNMKLRIHTVLIWFIYTKALWFYI